MTKNVTPEVVRNLVKPPSPEIKADTESPAREMTSHDNRPIRKALAGDLLRPADEYRHGYKKPPEPNIPERKPVTKNE